MTVDRPGERGAGQQPAPAAQVPLSAFPEICWPALPKPADAMVHSLLWQLGQSQWWPAGTLAEWQMRQLAQLAGYAAREVPFYRDRLDGAATLADGELTAEQWRQIPLLTRSDVQTSGSSLAARNPLSHHGPVHAMSTSGSTGEPVRVLRNKVTSVIASALTVRDHLWHDRDFSAKVGVIRRLPPEAAEVARTGKVGRWGVVYPSGPMVFFDIGAPVEAALDWLLGEAPEYLMTYPSYLKELLRAAGERAAPPPRLREVLAVGEPVDDELRTMCRAAWGAPLVDMYSCQEVGMMALEAPRGGGLLVQAEAVYLEVLRDDGTPCAQGEVGRVVVTSLHNYAMPLLRYAVGDLAEVGPPSPCGRGLPVLRRVLGRARNMIVLPDGQKVWARLSGSDLTPIGPLRKVQLFQRATGALEARVIVERPLRGDEQSALLAALGKAIGAALPIEIAYVDDIPRSAGGKFEDVISEVPH